MSMAISGLMALISTPRTSTRGGNRVPRSIPSNELLYPMESEAYPTCPILNYEGFAKPTDSSAIGRSLEYHQIRRVVDYTHRLCQLASEERPIRTTAINHQVVGTD
jgi:hypothetical protein